MKNKSSRLKNLGIIALALFIATPFTAKHAFAAESQSGFPAGNLILLADTEVPESPDSVSAAISYDLFDFTVNDVTVSTDELTGKSETEALKYITKKSVTFLFDVSVIQFWEEPVLNYDYFSMIYSESGSAFRGEPGIYKIRVSKDDNFKIYKTATVLVYKPNIDENEGLEHGNSPNANPTSDSKNESGVISEQNQNKKSNRGRPPQISRKVNLLKRTVQRSSGMNSRLAIKELDEKSLKTKTKEIKVDAINKAAEKTDNDIYLKSANTDYFKDTTAFEKISDAAAATGATGVACLSVMIASDFRVLLWYKRRKENKDK